MSYRRPVPTIGDPSSAAERAQAPDAWALRDDLASLERVVGARRDIRRFRPDPVPDDVLTAVLTAGHRGPSVGHSQPWRFVVVTEAATRDAAALMADRCRLRQAAGMAEESARGLLDLRLEGIREAPVGVVVACDRRTPAAGVLGRATFPDADLWSCAAAIENIWLTARAHGLGLGWVTLFEPAELADLLGLPDGVETLGWLCLGWPDERPPGARVSSAPAGRRRLPLEQVVMRERWTERDAPTSHLRAPEPADVVAARDRSDDLLTVPGLARRPRHRARPHHRAARSGRTGHPRRRGRRPRRDGIRQSRPSTRRSRRTSPAPPARARRWVPSPPAAPASPSSSSTPGSAAAEAISSRPTRSTSRRMPPCWVSGRERGRALAGTGPVALGEVGVGNTTVAAALAAALLGVPAEDVVGRGSSADAAMLDRKRDVVTRALARVGSRSGPRRPCGGSAAESSPCSPGVVLGVAEAGGVVVLDGLATSVCALAAVRARAGGRGAPRRGPALT